MENSQNGQVNNLNQDSTLMNIQKEEKKYIIIGAIATAVILILLLILNP